MQGSQFNPYLVGNSSKDADLLRWQLTTYDLIEDIKHSLKCEKWDDKKHDWVKQKDLEPLVNEQGINDLVGFVENIANKNTILSNLTEKEVNNIMIFICDNVADAIFLKFEDYKIKEENKDMVFHKIEMMCFMSLKRAMNEGERAFLKQTERRTEIFKTGDEDKKSKLPSWLGFGGKD